jgi:type IV secretory pathway VirJ component
MKNPLRRLLWLCLFMAIGAPAHAQEQLSHGRFSDVTLYRPHGEARQFVLLLSGDDGWTRGVEGMARLLAAEGAMVAGISTPRLFSNLEADGGSCVFPDGDLENLSHYLQGYARLSTYHTPILVGYSSGATLAYAMIAQAPQGTFAGAISLGFCTDLELQKPLCRGEGVHFSRRADGEGVDLTPTKQLLAPWIALHGASDRVCDTGTAQRFAAQIPEARFVLLQGVGHDYASAPAWQSQFVDAYRKIASHNTANTPAPPASLADLPLVEVPAHKNAPWFAIMLSGDGGWAGLDKGVAAALAEKGVPVVGLDSLRYFWKPRTPQSVSLDLDRVLRHYAAVWKKPQALLVGYSQGADVLPFAVNRLPATSRSLVAQTILLGLGEDASFEFHLGNWLGAQRDALPIRPEAAKLTAAATLCLYGTDDDDSLCPKLPATSVTAQSLPGGHHFDGAYDKLAELILQRVNAP